MKWGHPLLIVVIFMVIVMVIVIIIIRHNIVIVIVIVVAVVVLIFILILILILILIQILIHIVIEIIRIIEIRIRIVRSQNSFFQLTSPLLFFFPDKIMPSILVALLSLSPFSRPAFSPKTNPPTLRLL